MSHCPQGECPHSQPIPNLHDCSSLGRQLIQELRLKQEKISFQTKDKRVEMQGESAGERARGKSTQHWRQKQRQESKTATSPASKQVNLDGRGARMPSALPWLGPVQGGI